MNTTDTAATFVEKMYSSLYIRFGEMGFPLCRDTRQQAEKVVAYQSDIMDELSTAMGAVMGIERLAAQQQQQNYLFDKKDMEIIRRRAEAAQQAYAALEALRQIEGEIFDLALEETH